MQATIAFELFGITLCLKDEEFSFGYVLLNNVLDMN